MPEGDTVWRVARKLHAALAGTELIEADLRVPRLAVTDLRGRRCAAVESRGKHLLARIDDWTLHTHLGMDGNWFAQERSGPPPRDHRVRVVLANERTRCVGRLLHQVELWPTAEEQRHLGHLGPDLLGDDWDPVEAERRLVAGPDLPIGVALLDQRIMAGLGNVYRNELCFLRGVLPTRRVAESGDLTRLTELSHRVIVANRDRLGRVFTGNTRPGMGTWVYGRAGRPCRRCGTSSERGLLGAGPGATPEDRITFFCPKCQT